MTLPANLKNAIARSHVVLLAGPRQSGKTTLARQLQSYHANLRKRQVKSPEIYIRDSGLRHQLLGIDVLKTCDRYLSGC